MHPILFKAGPLTIYTYGLFVVLGILSGYLVCGRAAKKEGVEDKAFSDIIFWTIVFGFLGAKVLYVLIEFKYFLENPLGVVRSGFVFYGGVISGVVSLFILSKRHKINFLKLTDIIVVGLPLAHAFGRIGCFFYGCCYGRIPTQLISSFSLLIIFLIMLYIGKRKKFNGQVLLSYVFIYGLFRFVIEFFRTDPRGYIFFFSTSQFISIALIITSIFLAYRWRKPA